ncbi:hypothetical protein [Providencia burhodogranariea]|uniref:Transmembrane protein n=1 Tax=Providencia burhodogranariea DSM 19968 TaxID=1141662 RepID=K8X0W0_9GAMM|nr:hypothetical protein [Providencia burhodogranariea]EKT63277.1 hypothetical protein OOA_05436 [Providencia burhodogranariea DSM 19968]
MTLMDIISQTPVFVWVILAWLIYRGINALQDREILLKRLFLLPLVFLILAGSAVAGQGELALVFMLPGLLVGGLIGRFCARRSQPLRAGSKPGSVIRPGSYSTLLLILFAFFTKFALISYGATHPKVQKQWLYNSVFGGISGVTAGLFWGLILTLVLPFQRQNKARSAAL